MEHNEEVMERILSYLSSKDGAYEAHPFGKTPICFKVMGKIFAQVSPEEEFYKMTLKCDKEQALVYRELYPGVVVRGYHCPPVQQPYWNTIDLYAFEEEELLYQMMDEAYEAVVRGLTRKARAQLLELAKLEYKDTDGEDKDFAMLCGKLDENLDELVGTKFQRKQYDQYNQRDSIHDVIVVYKGDKPIACGSFKRYDEMHAELKRIYVDKTCRGIGLGSEIVRRLEAKAKMQGFKTCILETGEPLQAACHMYQKLGYKVIPNYGQYVDMKASICMAKRI